MSEPTRTDPPPRPAPVPDAADRPFWEATARGELLVQRCTSCGHAQLYARDHCLACRGEVAWVASAGTGTVYAVTVIRTPMSRRFAHLAPYVVALVDLDEGARLMTNIVNTDPDTVAIGDRVRVRFEPTGDADTDLQLPLFEPAPDTP